MMVDEIKIDKEIQGMIPPLAVEEKEQLEANLVADGCRDALITWNGIMLDGHNRFEICQRLNIKYEVACKDFEDRNDAILWVIRNQFGRRNISLYDRGVLALKMKDVIAAKAKENKRKAGSLYGENHPQEVSTTLSEPLTPVNTRAELAKQSGVSEGTIAKIEIIQKKASPEQIGRLKSGEASVNQINNETKKPHVSQNQGENEWHTPSEYIEAVYKVMGSIDLDPASNELANKTVKAKTFYTKKDNGLDKTWVGKIFLNPPYSQPLVSQFADKFCTEYDPGHISQAIVIVNNSTDSKWFRKLVERSSAYITTGRVKFLDPQGNPGAPLQGQAIIYFGDNPAVFMEEFGKFGWGGMPWDQDTTQ